MNYWAFANSTVLTTPKRVQGVADWVHDFSWLFPQPAVPSRSATLEMVIYCDEWRTQSAELFTKGRKINTINRILRKFFETDSWTVSLELQNGKFGWGILIFRENKIVPDICTCTQDGKINAFSAQNNNKTRERGIFQTMSVSSDVTCN